MTNPSQLADRTRPSHARNALLLVLATALATLLLPARAWSTPAYARRYDTTCTTCHSPQPPRLNNVGMVFRRWGFRLPDADDKGNLVVKEIPAHGIGDAIAAQTIFDAVGDPKSFPGQNRGSLRLTEVGLVGGTSIDQHLSTGLIYLLRNDEGASELEDVEVQGNWGKPSGQFSLKGGLAETFNWQKAGVGVLTNSSPIVLGEDPVGPIGSFSGFGLGVKQVEVEAGWTHTSLTKGKIMSTMVSATALNGVNEDGSAADRNPAGGMDVLVQATQLFGSRNTAGAFYYHGRAVIDPAGNAFEDKYKRYGVLGNYAFVDRLEVAGSYVRGDDNSTELGTTISMRGGYAELVGQVTDHWIGVYRYEQVNPDKDSAGEEVKAHVLSTTYQALNNAFITGEYRQVEQAGVKDHNWIASLRFIY